MTKTNGTSGASYGWTDGRNSIGITKITIGSGSGSGVFGEDRSGWGGGAK